LIKINIEVVKKRIWVWVRDYTRYPVGFGMRQKFNTRWVWVWGWGWIFFTGMGMGQRNPSKFWFPLNLGMRMEMRIFFFTGMSMW